MAVSFRNVDVDPGAPLDQWPYEALVTLIERGTVRDWAVLTRALRSDPWGVLARQVEDYLSYERPWGVGELLRYVIGDARAEAERRERRVVADHIDDLVRRSALTQAEFARRIGTSASRLSTYRAGRVTPSASLVIRMENLVARL